MVLTSEKMSRKIQEEVKKLHMCKGGEDVVGIRIQREKCGITQEALAKTLGTDRSTIAKWEAPGRYPRCKLLPQLAEIFGCTIDELFP